MALHKGNHVKNTKSPYLLGASEPLQLRGIIAEAKAIRALHRSPFGFCKSSVNKFKK